MLDVPILVQPIRFIYLEAVRGKGDSYTVTGQIDFTPLDEPIGAIQPIIDPRFASKAGWEVEIFGGHPGSAMTDAAGCFTLVTEYPANRVGRILPSLVGYGFTDRRAMKVPSRAA